MTDIADTAINGVPNYDMYVMSMFEAMEFRGKPLSTWEQELNLLIQFLVVQFQDNIFRLLKKVCVSPWNTAFWPGIR